MSAENKKKGKEMVASNKAPVLDPTKRGRRRGRERENLIPISIQRSQALPRKYTVAFFVLGKSKRNEKVWQKFNAKFGKFRHEFNKRVRKFSSTVTISIYV